MGSIEITLRLDPNPPIFPICTTGFKKAVYWGMNWNILIVGGLALLLGTGCVKNAANDAAAAGEAMAVVDSLASLVSDSSVPAMRQAQSEEGFDAYFQEFLLAWQSGDPARLENYLHPDWGLFLIYNPGAYTMPTHFATAKTFVKDAYPYEFKRKLATVCELQMGKRPHFSCDTESWDHEGCIREDDVALGLVKMMDQMAEWELGEGKKDPAYPFAQKMGALETVSVYLTDLSLGWNFAFVDGKWYWVMVDMVEPCSA